VSPHMSCKPPPTSEAPWASYDGPGCYSTTHASSFTNIGAPAPPPTLDYMKKPQYPWHSDAEFDNRSTSRDAFTSVVTYSRPPQSCKPRSNFEQRQWDHTLTSTASSQFINYGNLKKTRSCRQLAQPIEWMGTADAPFAAQSTAQASFAQLYPPPRTADCRPSSRESSRVLYPNGFDYKQHRSNESTMYASYRPYASSSFPKIRARETVVGLTGRWQ